MENYASKFRTSIINDQALSLIYVALKAALKLKEITYEYNAVLAGLKEISRDLDVADKPEGQLSFKQLQFRTAVNKFSACIACIQARNDRLGEVSKELKDIFAECGPTLQRAESYAAKAKSLAEELMTEEPKE